MFQHDFYIQKSIRKCGSETRNRNWIFTSLSSFPPTRRESYAGEETLFFAISSIIKPEPFLLLALLSRWALSKVVMTQKFEPWVEFRLWKTNYFYFSQTFWWLSWASSYEHINHLGSCMIVRSFTSPQRHERQLFSPKKSHLPLSSYEMVK